MWTGRIEEERLMNRAEVHIARLGCEFSEFTVYTCDPNTIETIIGQEECFSLRTRVEFQGSGAIALLPLNLLLQVDFFAQPVGRGAALELGTARLSTIKGEFIYYPTLEIVQGPHSIGLVAETVYSLTALLRAGSAEGPALMTGIIEGLTIQTYQI
jgi:hypothetical protein